jgi:diguanylate cyclase (GGDEF)-like protein/PAS domain S-box-containing protein
MENQYRQLTHEKLQQRLDELQASGQKQCNVSSLQNLLHELQVHEIELEMQNRELREAQLKLEESRDRYADLYDFAPVGYLTLDQNGIIQELNLTAAASFGRTRMSLIQAPLSLLLAPGQTRQLIGHLRNVISAPKKQKVVTDLTLKHRQGVVSKARFESVEFYDATKQEHAIRSAMIDITEQKLAEEFLRQAHHELETKVTERTADLMAANQSLERESRERVQLDDRLRQAAKVFDSTQEGIVITDVDCNIVAVNWAFTQITGYSEASVKNQDLRILQSDQSEHLIDGALRASLKHTGHWQGEIWYRRKNGELFAAFENISTVKDEEGKLTNYIVVFADISTIKETQNRLNYLAHHDPLTNLPNRLLFNIKLEHALQRAKRHRHKFALLFLDLDRFKNINDTLGHKSGDALLQVIAKTLMGNVRAEDTVARFGGDEFVILLDEVTHAEDAAKLAEKIIASVAQPATVNGRDIVASTSIGISIYPNDADNTDDLIKSADIAMYHAKACGKQTYRFYTAELTAKAIEHHNIEHGLRQALTNHEFVLCYQPMVSLLTGDIVGVEALLRWRHPDKGLIPPEDFIHVAEETGIICDIGEWVLQEACRQVKIWSSAGLPPMRIAINVSVRQIMYDDLAGKVRSACKAAKLRLDEIDLEMEITESVLQSVEQSIDTLNALHAIGIKLSIDDFGTGYSSLSKLKHLPIDTIKIDRSFVSDIPSNPEGQAIVTAIIALARTMKLNVVAEGVESRAQFEFLQSQGCNDAQGFLFDEALTSAKLCQLIGQGRYNSGARGVAMPFQEH